MALGESTDQIIAYSRRGQANGKKPYWPWDYKDFGPRLAFAYAPNFNDGLLRSLFGASGKTSIRGGFWIVFDHFWTALVFTFYQNRSFWLKQVISNCAPVPTPLGGRPLHRQTQVPTSTLTVPPLSP